MISNPKNTEAHAPRTNVVVMDKISKHVMLILFLIVLITVMFIKQQNECDVIKTVIENGSDKCFNSKQTNSTVNNKEKFKKIQRENTSKFAMKQLSCPKSYIQVILNEICTELVIKKEQCTPEDLYNHSKHKIPRKNIKYQQQKEPKVPAIINYAVGGLLLSSVGAALVELYKAKKQSPNKNGKNPLSRKCSLADLTVLKHHRKELIRRESILEVPEESNHTKQLGRKVSRPPLRFD